MNVICLTFDTDHMDDTRMSEFLAGVSIPGKATLFCTQTYSCLNETVHELAPHPYLGANTDWMTELRKMRALFPTSTGWRSHSCVYSHLLSEWVGANGYMYASTQHQLGCVGIAPIRETFGLWQMPIYYMDNLDFSDVRFWGTLARRPFDVTLIERALTKPGLYLFDFHPIHLMLNSPSYEFYAAARDGFKAGGSLRELSYKGYGARLFFEDLLLAMRSRGRQSISLDSALSAHLAITGNLPRVAHHARDN